MKYEYIIFNSPDDITRVNKDGYYYICMEDLQKLTNIKIISCPLEHKSFLLRYIRFTHERLCRYLQFCKYLRFIWFPFILDKNIVRDPSKTCFISLAPYVTVAYIKYLRKKYPNAKFVRLGRDFIHLYQKSNPEWTPEKMHEMFDVLMSWDKNEAAKYNMTYFSEFESKIDIEDTHEYESDVFFAGAAKDRFPQLLEAYEIFTNAGLKCDYYIVGVSPEDQKHLPGITYARSWMPYRQMLERTLKTRCVLEINQKGAIGYTSRFLEAIMYRRKLITNNITIRDTEFYNPNQIQCVENISDINPLFVKEETTSFFNYKDQFSPVHLIEQIDNLLP